MEKEKTWLYKRIPNDVTVNDPSDYIAKVIITASMTDEDIARKVVERGTVFDYSTLLNAFRLRDQVILDFLSQGLAVVTGTCQYLPSITGVLDGTTFNPQKNRCTVNINPSVEMRRMLEKVKAEYGGYTQESGGAEISKVEDTTTGRIDGTITPGGIVNIWGKKIKVVKDDGTTAGAIVFVDSKGVATPVTTALGTNEPKHISFIVPASLTNGNYTLELTTKFTSHTGTLKEERTITCPLTLVVGSGSGEEGGDDIL